MADPWKKVEQSPTWDYKVDNEFVGIYISREENVGPNNSNLYNFEKKNGEMIAVWGSSVLDVRFKNLKFGEEVKIEYLGKQKSEQTGREYHAFEVYHRMPVFEKEGVENGQ